MRAIEPGSVILAITTPSFTPAGKPVDDKTLTAVAGLADALSGTLGEELDGQITRAEIAALHRRACALLDNPVMPGPNRHRAIPWPAF